LLAVVDALPRGHHAVRVVLAGGKGRRHAVREKDERVVRPLVTAKPVRAEGHVVVCVHVEDAGQHVLIVAKLDDPRALCLVGRDRAIDVEQPSGDDEYSLIAHDIVACCGEQPAAANDDGIASERGDPRCVLRRVLCRHLRRQTCGHGGGQQEANSCCVNHAHLQRRDKGRRQTHNIVAIYLVQLLLPLYDNAGRAFPASQYTTVRDELTARFGGLTAYTRAPAQGLWQNEGGAPKRDDIVVYEVMTD